MRGELLPEQRQLLRSVDAEQSFELCGLLRAADRSELATELRQFDARRRELVRRRVARGDGAA